VTVTAARERSDDTITVSDGTRIYYKDWGKGQVYRDQSHGMCSTNKDQINADLLAFLEV